MSTSSSSTSATAVASKTPRLIEYTDDALQGAYEVATERDHHNPHVWLVKFEKHATHDLIHGVWHYGMHTNCGIFFHGDSHYRSPELQLDEHAMLLEHKLETMWSAPQVATIKSGKDVHIKGEEEEKGEKQKKAKEETKTNEGDKEEEEEEGAGSVQRDLARFIAAGYVVVKTNDRHGSEEAQSKIFQRKQWRAAPTAPPYVFVRTDIAYTSTDEPPHVTIYSIVM